MACNYFNGDLRKNMVSQLRLGEHFLSEMRIKVKTFYISLNEKVKRYENIKDQFKRYQQIAKQQEKASQLQS